ncbi:RNA polymerase sigma factor [Thermophagus sp. OGC60D27]
MQDDKHIIKLVLQGDVAAYSELVDRYRHMVFTLAMQLTKNESDAEEVAQDAFLKAFRALSKFEGRSSFSTWIYRITYHQSITMLRKNKKHAVVYDERFEKEENNPDEENVPFERLEKDDRKRFLKASLERLKGQEAFILTLYYYEGRKVEEISQITGFSVSNVKVRLFRARKNLLKELKYILQSEAGSLL